MEGKLDIRFEKIPYTGSDTLTVETMQTIINTLQAKFGHLAQEMNKTNGYFVVKTMGDNVYGNPLHKDVTIEVGIQIMQAASL